MSDGNPTVKVPGGTLAGSRSGDVNAYFGIPYGASPAGEYRWRAPRPAEPWSGVRDATRFGPDPIQPPGKVSRAPGIDEDCLTVNVWTPADRASGPWPVMVWIEGGSFMTESGAYARTDGSAFARRGVVLVTINYRVNVFGFLAHPLLTKESPHHASGNYGMMDQLAALRWVRENIAAFGGDAGQITVFGVSAGSASIALFLTSPHARGLFDRAILHSAGSLRPLCKLADAEAAGSVAGTDLAAMRALPAAEMLPKSNLILPKVRGLTIPRILRPILDGYIVPREESEAYDDGDFMNIPVMVGGTANEGGWAVNDIPITTVDEYRGYIAQNFADATAEALDQYPVRTDADVKPALAEVFGDTQFSYGARGLARAISRKQPKTFRYVFNRGPANHSDDTPYVFGNPGEEFDDVDRRLSDAMQRYWVQFARSGDPNLADLPAWRPFDAAADNYLEFGAEPAARDHWRTGKLDFIERFLRSRKPAATAR
jgi:carboxylesterase type B